MVHIAVILDYTSMYWLRLNKKKNVLIGNSDVKTKIRLTGQQNDKKNKVWPNAFQPFILHPI